jgi:hypothetical protein
MRRIHENVTVSPEEKLKIYKMLRQFRKSNGRPDLEKALRERQFIRTIRDRLWTLDKKEWEARRQIQNIFCEMENAIAQLRKDGLRILEPKNHPVGFAPKELILGGCETIYELLRSPLPLLVELQSSEPGSPKEDALIERVLRSKKEFYRLKRNRITKSMLRGLLKSMLTDIRQMTVEDIKMWSKVRKPHHRKTTREERPREISPEEYKEKFGHSLDPGEKDEKEFEARGWKRIRPGARVFIFSGPCPSPV